jgi:hypothetical protein
MALIFFLPGDTVQGVSEEGDNRLHGFRGDNGKEIYTRDGALNGVTGLRHFTAILAAAGRSYIAGDGRIFAFELPRSG